MTIGILLGSCGHYFRLRGNLAKKDAANLAGLSRSCELAGLGGTVLHVKSWVLESLHKTPANVKTLEVKTSSANDRLPRVIAPAGRDLIDILTPDKVKAEGGPDDDFISCGAHDSWVSVVEVKHSERWRPTTICNHNHQSQNPHQGIS